MSEVKLTIPIVAEFKGTKAFKQADTAAVSLQKTIKNLGKSLGIAFSARAIYNYTKDATAGFIAEEKAVFALTNTMKNLGLAFATNDVNAYINQLSRASGVIDDQLRPAMQALLQVTGDVGMSQKALSVAIGASRSTGIDLTTVANDLAQAYVGNLKGLRKYNLGLTQSELKAMSYMEIQQKLADTFGGSNQAYLNSYAGKMDRLNVAQKEFKDSVGKGLVTALAGGSTDADFQHLLDNIEKFGNFIELAGYKAAYTFKILSAMLHLDFKKMQELQRQKELGPAYKGAIPSIESIVKTSESAKALKLAADRQKAITAELTKQARLQKEKLILQKASNVLNQANKLFDNEQIQLAAALQGKLSEEDKVRVKLKQDILGLEEAIQTNNIQAAASFSNAIVQDSEKLRILRGDLNSFGDVANPFSAWLETIKQMAAELAKLASVPIATPATQELIKSSTYSTTGSETGSYGGFTVAPIGSNTMTNVTVMLDGTVVGNAINDTLINQSLSGTQSSTSRALGQFSAGYYR